MNPAAYEITPLPVLGRGAFRFRRRQPGSILDLPNSAFTQSGAAALRAALRAESIGSGDEVLVPAYHCKAMVAPIVAVGATPIFFGITEELACDSQSIVRAVTKRTRAILVPHLFGRVQSLQDMAALCAELQIILIEDCAHAIVGSRTMPVGEAGDYVIASPRKFAPVPEGGFIAAMSRPLPVLARPSCARNIRVTYDVFDHALHAGRLPGLAMVVHGAARLVRRLKSRSDTAEDVAAEVARGNGALAAALRSMVNADAACAMSALMFGHWDYQGAAEKRRSNYTELENHIRSCGGRVLESSLELSQAPYMVPTVLAQPRSQFAALRESGLPAWRWETSVRGVCKVTDYYAESLAQIPCHQSLNDFLIQRMCGILDTVLRRKPGIK